MMSREAVVFPKGGRMHYSQSRVGLMTVTCWALWNRSSFLVHRLKSHRRFNDYRVFTHPRSERSRVARG